METNSIYQKDFKKAIKAVSDASKKYNDYLLGWNGTIFGINEMKELYRLEQKRDELNLKFKEVASKFYQIKVVNTGFEN